MTAIPPAIAELAGDICARELAKVAAPQLGAAVERLFSRVYSRLATIVGAVGFRAVMTRAVHLAIPSCAWIGDVEIVWTESSLALTGIAAAVEANGAETICTGAAVLLEQLLGLLARFIGEPLTVRIIRREWPEAPAEGGTSGSETEDP